MERIHRELIEFTAGRDTWPTRQEFLAAGRSELWEALRRHGGREYWDERMPLQRRSQQYRRGLTPQEAVAQAHEVIALTGTLPSAPRLRAMGYPKLSTFVMGAGGVQRFLAAHPELRAEGTGETR